MESRKTDSALSETPVFGAGRRRHLHTWFSQNSTPSVRDDVKRYEANNENHRRLQAAKTILGKQFPEERLQDQKPIRAQLTIHMAAIRSSLFGSFQVCA